MLLGDALSNQPFEVLEGEKVIEVRLRGVSKAIVAHRVHAETCADTLVVAIGDDRTDEDLFRALAPSSLTVAVGRRPTCARFRVNDYRAVRQILRSLLADGTVSSDGGSGDPYTRSEKVRHRSIHARRPALVSALLRNAGRLALSACSMTPFSSAPMRIARPET